MQVLQVLIVLLLVLILALAIWLVAKFSPPPLPGPPGPPGPGGPAGPAGVSGATFEIAATEMAVGLHVADHGLDGGATSQFAFDDVEHAALLSGDENAVWVCGVVAAVSLVDIGALDVAAGEPFDGVDDGAERVAVVRIARQRLGVQDELTARRAGIAGDDRSPNSIGRAGLTVPNPLATVRAPADLRHAAAAI